MRQWIRERWDYFLVGAIAVVAIAALVLAIIGLGQAGEIGRLRAELDQLKEEKTQLETDLSGNISQLRTENDRRWEEHLRLPNLTIERGVRIPLTEEWVQELEAKTGQKLEFSVTISSDAVAHNVWVKAELPQLLFYRDNLKVDGVAFFGDVTDGINIGTVTPCEDRVVIFEAITATASLFPVGTTILTVPIEVWADCVQLDSGEITIVVERKAPAPSGGGGTRRPPSEPCPPGGPSDGPGPGDGRDGPNPGDGRGG